MDERAARPDLAEEGPDRGRGAHSPREVPPRGWKDVAVRTVRQSKADGVSLLAAGVAFYALLALVPSLVALVSLYGLVADPEDIERSIDDSLSAAPEEVRDLVSSQLSAIVESEPSGLQLGVLVGVVVALWSASSGMKNLVLAVNLAYDEEEGRKFLKLRGLALAFTLGAVLLAGVAVAAVVLPRSFDGEGAEGVLRTALEIGRWPVLAVLGLLALTALYRWGPDRTAARWSWVSPGAVLALVVAVVASVGFSIYTANFGSYNETYGALAAIVVVMLWLFLVAYAVIFGAELNAELERQTAVDSTTGAPEPLGSRGAHAADSVGRPTGRRFRRRGAHTAPG